MIRSMTGYGKSVVGITGRKLTIEIKSLNSKQFELNMKIPGFLRERELETRNYLNQHLDRGKIDFFIGVETTGELLSFSLNHEVAMQYHKELKSLKKKMRDDSPLLPIVMKMPEVVQTEKEGTNEQEWAAISDGIAAAVKQVNEYRTGEGAALEEDMLKRVQSILQLLDCIDPFEAGRTEEVRERLQRGFTALSGDFNGSSPDLNRFEQELIYYIEKLDITEEKVRLLKHCQYFLETLGETIPQGKKLGFVAQEMGREINTIGSKASHAEIQKIVVQMKDELEKIKEQLMNIL